MTTPILKKKKTDPFDVSHVDVIAVQNNINYYLERIRDCSQPVYEEFTVRFYHKAMEYVNFYAHYEKCEVHLPQFAMQRDRALLALRLGAFDILANHVPEHIRRVLLFDQMQIFGDILSTFGKC